MKKLLAKDWELNSEQDVQKIYFTLRHDPDPAWQFVDAAGHKHSWVASGDDFELPTLEWVSIPGLDDEGFEFDAGHYECKECRETISPGLRVPDPAYVAGLGTVTGFMLVASSDAPPMGSDFDLEPYIGVPGRGFATEIDYVGDDADVRFTVTERGAK